MSNRLVKNAPLQADFSWEINIPHLQGMVLAAHDTWYDTIPI